MASASVRADSSIMIDQSQGSADNVVSHAQRDTCTPVFRNTCSCGWRVCVSRCVIHHLHGDRDPRRHHFDDAHLRIHNGGKRTATRAETALRCARARSDLVALAGLCFRDGASFDLVCPANIWKLDLTKTERQRLGTVRLQPFATSAVRHEGVWSSPFHAASLAS
jgi:hypothetical protein